MTDQTLLTPGPHQNISDYAAVTRYLDASAVRALQTDIVDQTHDRRHLDAASGLATAAVQTANNLHGKGRGEVALGRLRFPDFAPYSLRIHLDPTVKTSKGRFMVVTGSCSVRIPAIYDGRPKTVVVTRTLFRYYLTTRPSHAAQVGVDSWYSQGSFRVVDR